MKKVAILQSNYIPWKGYFDMINSVDTFVLYDDMQYTKNDWRNRNKIKTQNGAVWLSIPVRQEKLAQTIKDTKVLDSRWAGQHLKTISQNYAKAPHFKSNKEWLEELYNKAQNMEFLTDINTFFLRSINTFLGIKTEILSSSDFVLADGKTERLVALCQSLGADVYISGPSAKDYLDEALFSQEKITVEWMDYSGYQPYNQLFPPFEHGVSVIDLILNEGDEALKFMKSFNK
ncbi:MAG: WbqC family protein [Sulfurospirillaceae bacterium]|nr:WbqC family protein [Sulfurospirillaceae bacterium]MDD3462766.1 WbqC family protein [Sulfurospirillaceae bacterium]